MLTWLLLTLSVLWGCGSHADHSEATEQAPQTLWTCPMHPEILREEFGSCPICGMDLVERSGEPEAGHADHSGHEGHSGGEAVHIDAHVVQNMGVRTQRLEPTTLSRHLRVLGEVEVGEDELSVVSLRVSGWVEKVYVERTGDPVKVGQRLFELYSPELVAAQEEYLLAIRTQGADSQLARSAQRRIELWGIAAQDLQRVAKAGEPSRTLPIRAPGAGFVLSKAVVEGASVQAGQELYRIGDLQSIWVTAEVYEFEAPWIEVGQPAELSLSYAPGTTLQGSVAYVYPTLDPLSRTLRVRLEFENPGVRLKPGMFATVDIQAQQAQEVLAVPGEAILRSGNRDIVFVQAAAGTFEPREVGLGLQGDGRMTEIRSGLQAGDEIVLSGQFLIDSESQLQEALRQMTEAR